MSFIGFLFNNFELIDEIGFGLGPASRAIIGTYSGRTPNYLLAYHPGRWIIWQVIDQHDGIQPDFLCSFFELFFHDIVY